MIEGARTYHIRFSRDRAKTALGVVRNPRHFIIYRRREDRNAIDIGRILHDGRDLQRHLLGDYRRMDAGD
jgi:toxin ParE1/3/4